MDLKQLEYFRHVAELGSFTRAASFLSVVQPALSRQVRQLEIELGQSLFERNGRGVVLTAAGNRLLEHARGILTQVGRVRQDLEDQLHGDSGHVALGLPPSLGRCVTVPLVHAFKLKLPNAGLATVEALSTYMIDWLSVGRVDCALVYNSLPSPAVDLEPLWDDQLYLIGPRGGVARKVSSKPVTLAQVSEYPLIIPGRPHATRMRIESALAGVGRKIRIAHEIESIPAVLDLVRQGIGHAVFPMYAIRSTGWADELSVKPIALLKSSLSLATSAQRPKGPLLRRALDVIREVVRQEIRSAEKVQKSPKISSKTTREIA
jgi:LysR family nitrogen assimilation transcriptional regulator